MESSDVEVDISHGGNKAVIEGKTAVPFKKFVMLILQRKVTALFKDWGDNKVIIDSELLTSLASASQDSQENKSKLVLVSLGVGVLVGVFSLAVIQVVLLVLKVPLGIKELAFIIGSLVGLAVLTIALSRTQKRNRAEKVVEALEKVTTLVAK